MSDIDEKIKEALKASDEKWLEEYEADRSVFCLVSDTFKSKQRWLVMIVFIFIFLFFGLSIYFGYQAFNAEELRDVVIYATAFVTCFFTVSFFKVWYWMELNKHAQSREIKKLELQIARLSAKLE